MPEGPPPVSESERALLQDLRQRRKELDAGPRQSRPGSRCWPRRNRNSRPTGGELQTLQKKLEGLDAAQKQKEDAGWQGLVKLYETMKPKDAAAIFNDLQMPVLLQVTGPDEGCKAAAVMAAMNPDKARDVTAELAQMRTGRNAAQVTTGTARSNPTGG